MQTKIEDFASMTTPTRVVDSTITFTFGDAGENHTGNQIIGEKLSEGQGFTIDNLRNIKLELEKYGLSCELYNLNELVSEEILNESCSRNGFDSASVLVIRQFVPENMANELYDNHKKLAWDNKYYCTRRKKVLNKHARHNLMYSDAEQKADYDNKKGTIVPWSQVPILATLRLAIAGLGVWCNNKSCNLICEGNNYYDKKTGIGWHGDTERTKVVAIRVGKSMSLCYKWWYKNKSRGKLFNIELNNGDMYIMSEKSVGNDWKRSSIWSLRHSAGAEKYTKVTK